MALILALCIEGEGSLFMVLRRICLSFFLRIFAFSLSWSTVDPLNESSVYLL